MAGSRRCTIPCAMALCRARSGRTGGPTSPSLTMRRCGSGAAVPGFAGRRTGGRHFTTPYARGLVWLGSAAIAPQRPPPLTSRLNCLFRSAVIPPPDRPYGRPPSPQGGGKRGAWRCPTSSRLTRARLRQPLPLTEPDRSACSLWPSAPVHCEAAIRGLRWRSSFAAPSGSTSVADASFRSALLGSPHSSRISTRGGTVGLDGSAWAASPATASPSPTARPTPCRPRPAPRPTPNVRRPTSDTHVQRLAP